MTVKIKGLQQFRSYENLEEEGVFVDIAENLQWKIRRLRSKPVNDAREKIYGPYERTLRGNSKLPESVEVECTIKLLSRAVVVDWRSRPSMNAPWVPHMVDDDGNPVTFSPEACKELLSDPDIGKDLRATIINLSTEGDMFTPEAIEADAGNSAAS